MIKRRFYKFEHGDNKDEPSDSSSSSSSSSFSDPESDAEAFGEEFESGGDGVSAPAKLEETGGGEDDDDGDEDCSTSSGYVTDDSSANELEIESSGRPMNDEDDNSEDDKQVRGDDDDDDSEDDMQARGDDEFSDKPYRFPGRRSKNEEDYEADLTGFPPCVLKCKSVFKCRICPRIICLNEETLKVHLQSKRHSRSEKLLSEGRLKNILNSYGEIDNEDTSTKDDAEIANVPKGKRKKVKGGLQRPKFSRKHKSKKNKVEQDSDVVKTRSLKKESPAKKRRKQEK